MNKIFEKTISFDLERTYTTSQTSNRKTNVETVVENIGRNSFSDLTKLNSIDGMKNSPSRIDDARPGIASIQSKTNIGKIGR